MIKKLIFCSLIFAAVFVLIFFLSKSIQHKNNLVVDIDWHDGTNFLIDGKGWTDTLSPFHRLPAKAKGLVNDNLWFRSTQTSGLNIRFKSDAKEFYIQWTLSDNDLSDPEMSDSGASGIDLYGIDANNEFHFLNNKAPKAIFNEAHFRSRQIRHYNRFALYLPLYNGIKSLKIGIPRGTRIWNPVPPSIIKKPIIFYGTSITQGNAASRPGMSSTAIVGRKLNWPVVNLGFAGQGKMDPEMAHLLAELDASVYVIDCLWNMTAKMVYFRTQEFIKALRQKRSATPIILVEDSNVYNISPTINGQFLRLAFLKLKQEGYKHIYFLSNDNLIGTDQEGTVDGCHLNDLGMMRQAKFFTEILSSIIRNER